MSTALQWNTSTPLGLRVGVGVAVVFMHAVVAGAVLFLRAEPKFAKPVETVEVRFVEIAPQVQVAAAPPKPEPPKPEPKPEPPKPKPKPKPTPKPVKPLPQPDPEPSETVLSQPEPAPAEPAPEPVAQEPVGKPEQASRNAAPQAPVDDQPKLVSRIEYLGERPTPQYPRTSIRLGEEGQVLVRLLINTRGRVDQATLEKSSGFARLDEAALEAAKRGRFKPYTENGVAIAAIAIVPFNFTLRN